MDPTPPPIDDNTRHQHANITARMARIGLAMPGSLTARYTRCSSTGCRCQHDDNARHGPYWTWTRKAAGKTVGRTITPNDAERYTPWFDNARQLRTLTSELEALTLALAHANGWGEK